MAEIGLDVRRRPRPSAPAVPMTTAIAVEMSAISRL
jgi:hypothetical protein